MTQKLNLEGQRFGKLLAVREAGRTKSMRVVWECKCACGKTHFAVSSFLLNGSVKSCGCLIVEMMKKKMRGNKIGLGKKRTVESRGKISRALKGRKFSSTHCANISKSRTKEFRENMSRRVSGENNPMYGKPVSQQTRKKISASLVGNKRAVGYRHTPETRTIMSLQRSGENSWNWKGGKSERVQDPYCAIFRDDEFRSMIFERDEYQCQNPDCWGTCEKLCPHHIDYDKKNCVPVNVITLCLSCNTRANANRIWHQEFYSSIVQEKYEEKQ